MEDVMGKLKAAGQLALMPDRQLEPESTGYQMLPSVWEGTDAALLERMLDFYPRTQPQRILDATVNMGRFWEGTHRPVIGMDIEEKVRPDLFGDNPRMPFRDHSFDVVVYDPPHVPNQGRDLTKDFNLRFGLVLKSSAENGYNLAHLYPPFIREAYRVLSQRHPILQDYRLRAWPSLSMGAH